MNTTTPIPEPREVLGLTASFSGIAAMLVIATLAPHPISSPGADATPVVAEARAAAGSAHAVGV
jgi:hypothetical protein